MAKKGGKTFDGTIHRARIQRRKDRRTDPATLNSAPRRGVRAVWHQRPRQTTGLTT